MRQERQRRPMTGGACSVQMRELCVSVYVVCCIFGGGYVFQLPLALTSSHPCAYACMCDVVVYNFVSPQPMRHQYDITRSSVGSEISNAKGSWRLGFLYYQNDKRAADRARDPAGTLGAPRGAIKSPYYLPCETPRACIDTRAGMS
jgi:hypothetical protein